MKINYEQEFICMDDSVPDTQKKIQEWISSGYTIEILEQNVYIRSGYLGVVTSLVRRK